MVLPKASDEYKFVRISTDKSPEIPVWFIYLCIALIHNNCDMKYQITGVVYLLIKQNFKGVYHKEKY